jgi:hypothetical protein
MNFSDDNVNFTLNEKANFHHYNNNSYIMTASVWLVSMISKNVCLVVVSNRTRVGLDFPAIPHGNNSCRY